MLLHRRRLLLAVLQAFGGQLPNRDFQKYLMLHELELAAVRSYDFVPYKYGGFSFQSYADRRSLIAAGLLLESDGWELATDEDFLEALEPVYRKSVTALRSKYRKLKGRNLLKEVYRRFPYYAIRSEIASELMNENELSAIERARPSDDAECLFTIGYEGISLDTYLDRLVRKNVQVLCDVRRNPLSRKYGFSKSTLRSTVEALAIRYEHFPQLGISSDKRGHIFTQQDYNRLLTWYEQTTLVASQDALNALADLLAKNKRVAITCFEANVRMCHRGRIVNALTMLSRPPAAIEHL